jgi:hypothetical protein
LGRLGCVQSLTKAASVRIDAVHIFESLAHHLERVVRRERYDRIVLEGELEGRAVAKVLAVKRNARLEL